jgi:hypothetical protein
MRCRCACACAPALLPPAGYATDEPLKIDDDVPADGYEIAVPGFADPLVRFRKEVIPPPGLLDTCAGDFRPLAGSAAAGAALMTMLPCDDHFGNARRADGSAVGAIEAGEELRKAAGRHDIDWCYGERERERGWNRDTMKHTDDSPLQRQQSVITHTHKHTQTHTHTHKHTCTH